MIRSLVAAFSLALSLNAQAAQVALLAGTPDESLNWVQEIVKGGINLDDPLNVEKNVTTEMLSVLHAEGISSVKYVSIINAQSMSTERLLMMGMHHAADQATVVVSPLGPVNYKICHAAAINSDTIFILGAGADSQELKPSDLPGCIEADNLLIVTMADPATGELKSNANWGDQTIQLAVATRKLRVIGEGGQVSWRQDMSNNLARLAAAVAASGAYSVDHFLEKHTRLSVPLIGKVKGARIFD